VYTFSNLVIVRAVIENAAGNRKYIFLSVL